MDGMSNNASQTTLEAARVVARFLNDHKGERTVALHVGEKSSFTDYFVITTATSAGHMRGLVDQLYGLLDTLDLKPRHGHRRAEDNGWILIDCGTVVVHLMSSEFRDFYDLERLWYGCEVVFDGEVEAGPATIGPA